MKAANKITNWTHDKPTEAGDYLCCYGDVEVSENVIFTRILNLDGILVDLEGNLTADYRSPFKFARLIYEPTERTAL